MKRISDFRFEALFVALGTVSSLLTITGAASAQGYEPPNSLQWPLYAADPSLPKDRNGGPGLTAPRPAIGNVLGEFQDYASTQPYLHSGTDIRGVVNDPIVAVADGYVWMKANFMSDLCTTATNCRFYVAGVDKRYIYYYSHVRLDESAPNYSKPFHDKIIQASTVGPTSGSFASITFPEAQRVNRGEHLTGIANFTNWNHLHFGIVDATQNFDVINPLTALPHKPDGVEVVDDEKPTVEPLAFYQDNTSTLVTPAGDCQELANAGSLDIVAKVKDSFYSVGPAPADITGDYSTIGPSYGEYRIQRVGDPEVAPVVWYDFTRAPLRCAGSARGLDCPSRPANASDALQQFLTHSIKADAGALNPGSIGTTDFYAAQLFSAPLSDSTNYPTTDGEKHYAVFTNSWGLAGAWSAGTAADGLYRVSVETRDQAGNRSGNSRLVFVNNTGSVATNYRDAYIRDNPVETGALPSTIGGQPFWTSPDIVIMKDGAPLPTPRVIAGQTYQVYLDVHNPTCGIVRGVRARLFTANPSMIQNQGDWVDFTGGLVGSTDIPALDIERLGPFDWTPTAEEAANEGHRCMLAMIDSTDDPLRLDVTQVASDNNLAQLNLQVDAVSFSIRNPEPEPEEIELEFRCNDFPINRAGAKAEIRVQSHPALLAAWANADDVTITEDGSELVVRYELCNVRLPPVALPGGTLLPASAKFVLPPNVFGSYTLDFAQYIGGQLAGGMSFNVSRADEPPDPH
jgi:hypothetical protein